MTVLTDLNAITPTANAISAAHADGTDVSVLLALAKQRAAELQILERAAFG
jgi:hypothetical protein